MSSAGTGTGTDTLSQRNAVTVREKVIPSAIVNESSRRELFKKQFTNGDSTHKDSIPGECEGRRRCGRERSGESGSEARNEGLKSLTL